MSRLLRIVHTCTLQTCRMPSAAYKDSPNSKNETRRYIPSFKGSRALAAVVDYLQYSCLDGGEDFVPPLSNQSSYCTVGRFFWKQHNWLDGCRPFAPTTHNELFNATGGPQYIYRTSDASQDSLKLGCKLTVIALKYAIHRYKTFSPAPLSRYVNISYFLHIMISKRTCSSIPVVLQWSSKFGPTSIGHRPTRPAFVNKMPFPVLQGIWS